MRHHLTLKHILIGMSLWFPVNAIAHCMCERAEPRVGSTVKPPFVVKVWFDENLDAKLSKLTVKNELGEVVDKGDSHVSQSENNRLEVGVTTLLPGKYSVSWTAASGDGHKTEGDYHFTVEQ